MHVHERSAVYLPEQVGVELGYEIPDRLADQGVRIRRRDERAGKKIRIDAPSSRAGRLAHSSIANAFAKKSSPPKLPDLSARCSATEGCVSVRAWHHGTPGSICGPFFIGETLSACTHAPAVSPPATTSCRTPRATSPCAMAASAASTMPPACSTPSRACTCLTAAGLAVE